MGLIPSGTIISRGENHPDPGKPISASVCRESPGMNKDSVLIFFVSSAVFTVHLIPEFIGFQTRFALFAQEMLRYGPTLFPTTYRIPYPDYTATSTYLIYLLSLPFGKVTVLSAILPTVVASALILVVIYRIGAMRSQEWGICAVLLALFIDEFLKESRSVALDQYASLVTWFINPLIYSHERTKPFLEKSESLQASRAVTIAFYRIGPDAEDIKFIANVSRPAMPIFIKNMKDLLQQSPQTYFIARDGDFDDLPNNIAQKMQVQFRGKIGHENCVVFSLRFGLSEPDSSSIPITAHIQKNERKYTVGT
jgi:hypothetical protein